MSRISLRETYDNRSVIAQIAKVTDTAEDAAETVEQKAAEINDAITEVNAAVTTANAASASAQQSAQTVAGYNTRLTTAEGEIDTLQSDLNSVTLRVQTTEGQIVTIQGRVTALETADANNVKITGTHKIGDYAVLLTGNQDPIAGEKTFSNNIKQKTTGTSIPRLVQIANVDSLVIPDSFLYLAGGLTIRDINGRAMWSVACYRDVGGRDVLSFEGNASDGTTTGYFHLELAPNGYRKITTNFDKPSTW